MFYFISRTIFEILMRILFRIRVSGTENIPKPPFIITSNHASFLDPPLVGISCRKYQVDFMAKKELFDAPIVGIWTRSVGCIEVNRGENSVKSLKEAIRRLRAGHVVGIFPEGTRSSDGSLQEAKRGIGFLIGRAAVPVVPVYVEGSAEAFPKGFRIRPGTKVSITVGKPIMPVEFAAVKGEKRDYEAIAGMVMDRIAAIV